MMEKFQRSRWPDDTATRIESMRAAGCGWEEIAASFGVRLYFIRTKATELGLLTPKKWRRLTPEEDAYIRAEYSKNTPIEMIAAHLGRTYGAIRTQLYSKHRDIVGNRSALASRAIKKYGLQVLEMGATPEQAAIAIREATLNAKAAARKSALDAKQARRQEIIDQMNRRIAEGCERNEAIFEARASGLELEKIAEFTGITRERVRQIYDQVAFAKAMALQAHNLQQAAE